jgi:uncharacterized protein YheU (UPF0270 family)
MAQFVEVPLERLDEQILKALLEEFSSRDGTDYGDRETTLEERVAQLSHRLKMSELAILYDADSQQWDLVDREHANLLLVD